MILGSGQFTLSMSERQVSIMLDALDQAVVGTVTTQTSTVFEPDDFAELGALLSERFRF